MSDIPPDSASASRIVSRGRDADRSVLAKLLEEFRPSLRAEAREDLGANLRKRADESDITQMTLLTAVDEFAAFRGETDNQLRAWLRAIQRQHIAALARQQNAAKRGAGREINPSADSSVAKVDLVESGCRPSRRMQLQELRQQIDRALGGLPESQQCVVRMRFLDEFSTQEIAELTGQSERAVAGLLRRGMTRLKDVLVGLQ
jgi:RNA polymerase sigma-70 factor (ECF subfamily)